MNNLIETLANIKQFTIIRTGDRYQVCWYVERVEYRTYHISARKTEQRVHKHLDEMAVEISKETARAIAEKMQEIGRFFSQRKADDGSFVELTYSTGYFQVELGAGY